MDDFIMKQPHKTQNMLVELKLELAESGSLQYYQAEWSQHYDRMFHTHPEKLNPPFTENIDAIAHELDANLYLLGQLIKRERSDLWQPISGIKGMLWYDILKLLPQNEAAPYMLESDRYRQTANSIGFIKQDWAASSRTLQHHSNYGLSPEIQEFVKKSLAPRINELVDELQKQIGALSIPAATAQPAVSSEKPLNHIHQSPEKQRGRRYTEEEILDAITKYEGVVSHARFRQPGGG